MMLLVPVIDISSKKFTELRSGDLGCHSISGWSFPDTCTIKRSGNNMCSYWRTSRWKWGGGTSVLTEYERLYVLQLCLMSQLQHVQICYASKGFFSKEEWAVHFLTPNCTKQTDFRRVTLMPHIGMWVFKSLYSDIAAIYWTAVLECRFVTELHLLQEMIIGTH